MNAPQLETRAASEGITENFSEKKTRGRPIVGVSKETDSLYHYCGIVRSDGTRRSQLNDYYLFRAIDTLREAAGDDGHRFAYLTGIGPFHKYFRRTGQKRRFSTHLAVSCMEAIRRSRSNWPTRFAEIG